MSFKGKTVLITGASRGIGKAIGLRLAAEGANIVVAAKSIEEDSRLGGTIFTAAAEMERAGGSGLPIACDIRNEEQVTAMVHKAVDTYGGIDIVVNNASAISLTSTEKTEAKRLDLMFNINVRGTFLVTKTCVPFLKKSVNPHVLTLSPPLSMNPKWFANHVAYTLTKYNMSMMAMGWAAEFQKHRIASNALWPKTTIATAAVRNLLGGEALVAMSRKPEIVADAAYYIFRQPSDTCTGNFFLDEEVLAREGITNLESYSTVPGATLYNDLFIE